MRRRILVLGDGLLGSSIVDKTNWLSVSRKKDEIDFINPETYEKWIKKDYYQEVINCIGCTKTYDKKKDDNWNVNYKGVVDLVEMCNKYNKKLIHISTDYLYSNSKEEASEEDVPVHCDNWYGYTKLLGDAYVQLKSNNYLLIRCTHKPEPFPYEKAFVSQLGNFDYVSKISDLIIQLIEKDSSGLYNVGTKRKTMWHLAKETKDDVKPTSKLPDESTPRNVTMDVSKLNKELGLDES